MFNPITGFHAPELTPSKKPYVGNFLQTLNYPITQFLEADLAAELEEPRIQNLRRPRPAGAVGAVHRADRAAVQRVIGIEVQLYAPSLSDTDDLADTKVQPRDPVFEERLRRDQRDVRQAGLVA